MLIVNGKHLLEAAGAEHSYRNIGSVLSTQSIILTGKVLPKIVELSPSLESSIHDLRG